MICECDNTVLYFFSPGVILGVTNPFFAKTLQHWPHMVRIGEMSNLGEFHLTVKSEHSLFTNILL